MCSKLFRNANVAGRSCWQITSPYETLEIGDSFAMIESPVLQAMLILYLESEFLLSVGGTAFCLHQSLSQLMPGLLAALFVVLCMPLCHTSLQ